MDSGKPRQLDHAKVVFPGNGILTALKRRTYNFIFYIMPDRSPLRVVSLMVWLGLALQRAQMFQTWQTRSLNAVMIQSWRLGVTCVCVLTRTPQMHIMSISRYVLNLGETFHSFLWFSEMCRGDHHLKRIEAEYSYEYMIHP